MRDKNGRRIRWSWSIGHIAGIDVRLHVTMVLLAWLVVLVAPEGQTPAEGLLWLVLIFSSVLAHELAHSLVARRLKVGVREIELLPIGGISKMDEIPDRPNDELRISLAGPLSSLAIGIAALAASAVVGASWWPPDIVAGELLPRLGWFNLMLGTFNLLPALPLDGGRVLRAVFEREVGPTAATHKAARIARYLAIGMIVIGAMTNLFLMLIGIFVHVASRAEDVAADIHAGLHDVFARDVMIHDPITVRDHSSLDELQSVVHRTTQRQFPVVDSYGRYLGMVAAVQVNGRPGSDTCAQVAVPVAPLTADAPVEPLVMSGAGGSMPPALAVVDERSMVIGLVLAQDLSALTQRIAAHQP